jgi:1-acyl-sn-glycerol-3-phosphate acyltransferase
LLRGLLAVPIIAVGTLLLGVPSILCGLLDRSGRWPQAVARAWSRIILFACGIHVVVEGAANVPAGPAVYAANHGSALDIPILFGHLPADFRIIHKRSLSLAPVVGWHLFLGGHVPIDRGNAFKARRSLEVAARRIREGTSVAVFPEGTRSATATVGHFKRGSLVLAINAGVPVVPVSLVGVKQVVPRGVLTLSPGMVRIRIHPPLPTSGREAQRGDAFAEEVRTIVAQGCEEVPA